MIYVCALAYFSTRSYVCLITVDRHSPTSEDAIIAKKEALLRRYLALNMKALNALKPIRRGTPCPPPPLEMSPSCSSIPGQSYNYFAKFGKPEDPEIFGVPPEKGSGADVAKPQAQKIHVTGDSEPCNVCQILHFSFRSI